MNSQEDLKKTLDEAEWTWLKPHAERDALILVAQSLPLLEVGEAIAKDLTQKVQEWIQKGLITKPTLEQMAAWDQEPNRKFLSLVVQPYVLMQDRFH